MPVDGPRRARSIGGMQWIQWFRTVARRRAVAALMASAALLAACNVGIWAGSDGRAPSISLAAAAASVSAGQSLRFVAAASDGDGIDSVAFYRVDASGPVLLGSDTAEPYQWDVVAPADGRTTLSVFARATDNVGEQSDSATVTVTVTP